MTTPNPGCTHYHPPHWNNHCGEMGCRNYKNNCPLHGIGGSTTAVCNLERFKSLMMLGMEARELAAKLIALNPVLEPDILMLAGLAYADGTADADS